MVLVDTSIIIDHLRLRGQNSRLIKLAEKFPQEKFTLSIISVQKLYEGRSTKELAREKELLITISLFTILSYTYKIAELAGTIARDLGKPVDFADMAIASTAIINRCPLFTLNKRDFQDVKGLAFV